MAASCILPRCDQSFRHPLLLHPRTPEHLVTLMHLSTPSLTVNFIVEQTLLREWTQQTMPKPAASAPQTARRVTTAQ